MRREEGEYAVYFRVNEFRGEAQRQDKGGTLFMVLPREMCGSIGLPQSQGSGCAPLSAVARNDSQESPSGGVGGRARDPARRDAR